ncbi:MAG: ATP-binding protein [Calditrichaeota bacterium]|nr:MAG: ATP-binding protein [Calditrichota bacterium]
MLIEFSVGNFLSFKETVTFSMVSASIKEHPKNTFESGKFKLLKSAEIYGANASGKSNLLKAMDFMKGFVQNSSKESQVFQKIKVENFRLSTETEGKPSFFEIIFLEKGTRFTYGFEVDANKVHSEWLLCAPKGSDRKLFKRVGQEFELGRDFREGKGLEDKTRKNALFVSVVAQFNGEISTGVLKYFSDLRMLFDGVLRTFTPQKAQNPKFKNKILNFLKIADLGINDFLTKPRTLEQKFIEVLAKENTNDLFQKGISLFQGLTENELSEISESMNSPLANENIFDVLISHSKFDESGKPISEVNFDLDKNESDGTSRLFYLSGYVIDALENGKILIVDELESSLHPNLMEFIVNLFNSEFNKNNAQLIFTTHNTNLLSNNFFRRDQIWFAEKDRFGATELFSLVEFKEKARNDSTFDKNYLLGFYGAVPLVGFPEEIYFEAENEQK